MQHVVSAIEQHGLLLLFLSILVARVGLPLPVIPILMTAGAVAGRDPEHLTEIVLVSVGASLVAEFSLFWFGRRYGQRFLAWLCKMSFSPDFCVRQTETVFTKLGPWSLVFAKFLPGLSFISVAMAGVVNMSVLVFFVLDGVGGLLFAIAYVGLGVIFQDAIASVFATLMQSGSNWCSDDCCGSLLYSLFKWWRRTLSIRQLRMDRITVPELRELIDAGQELIILDVRSREARARDGIIPGAISAHPEDIDPVIRGYSPDTEIIVYCACPNEASAATAAKHLKHAGFKKIRPLLGGIEAWVQAGHPLERVEVKKEAA